MIFGKWDPSEVKVEDPGLKRYINLSPVWVPRTGGRWIPNLKPEKVSIVERFMNKLMVPGHRGKKHKLTSGHCTANAQKIYLETKRAFEIIEKRLKKNPIQVLVKAIENAAIVEEIASYRLGGIIARKAVVVSPKRRLDLALRHLAQGIYSSSFKSKKTLAEAIAEELILAYNSDPKCFAIRERQRIEKEAEGAR
ncbi:MAG: 30S ribosomal protein S7 [Candidatus Aenigmatarchaeota archaeon]|nr:MAG: 30S ribosomal protein S7 [Candidatus Aenigmarchaeota archaeon]